MSFFVLLLFRCLKLIDDVEETILQCPPPLAKDMGRTSQLLLASNPFQDWL